MSDHFTIRAVEDTPEDLVLLDRFCHELAKYDGHEGHSTPEKLRSGLFTGPRSVHAFFAIRKGEAIGFILAYESFTVYHGERGLYVPGTYIIEQYRHLGYGAKLMRYIAAFALENGFSFLNWIVESKNANANAIYGKVKAEISEGWSYCRLSGDALINAAGGGWKETAYLMSDPVNAKWLLESIRQADEGKTMAVAFPVTPLY